MSRAVTGRLSTLWRPGMVSALARIISLVLINVGIRVPT